MADNDVICTPNTGILESNVTWDFVQETLQKEYGPDVIFGPNRKITRIADGIGFNSSMGLVEPDWIHKTTSLPDKFVLKICSIETIDENNEAANIKQSKLKRIHNQEVAIYKLMNTLKDSKIPRPTILASTEFSDHNQDRGIVIMELIENIHHIHVIDNLEVADVRKVLRGIGSLHAFTFQVPSEELKKLEYNIYTEFMPGFLWSDTINRYKEMLVDVFGDVFKYYIASMDAVLPHITSLEALEKLQNICETLGMGRVLCHGDLWAPNVIWSKKDVQLNLEAIVDFQTVHLGNPIMDTLMFMCCSLSTYDRRNHGIELQKDYYHHFIKEIGDNPAPFTFEQLLESYDLFFPLAAFYAIINLGDVYLKQMKQQRHDIPTVDSVKLKAIGLFEDMLEAVEMNNLPRN